MKTSVGMGGLRRALWLCWDPYKRKGNWTPVSVLGAGRIGKRDAMWRK